MIAITNYLDTRRDLLYIYKNNIVYVACLKSPFSFNIQKILTTYEIQRYNEKEEIYDDLIICKNVTEVLNFLKFKV